MKLIFKMPIKYKVSSDKNGIFKACLVEGMIKLAPIAVAGCGLHYFVLARFGSIWVVANFRIAERFKYLIFTAKKIRTMVRIVKKRNSFIFSSLQPRTKYLRKNLVFMWNSALWEKFYLCYDLFVLTKFSFREEDWKLGYNSMKFQHYELS